MCLIQKHLFKNAFWRKNLEMRIIFICRLLASFLWDENALKITSIALKSLHRNSFEIKRWMNNLRQKSFLEKCILKDKWEIHLYKSFSQNVDQLLLISFEILWISGKSMKMPNISHKKLFLQNFLSSIVLRNRKNKLVWVMTI